MLNNKFLNAVLIATVIAGLAAESQAAPQRRTRNRPVGAKPAPVVDTVRDLSPEAAKEGKEKTVEVPKDFRKEQGGRKAGMTEATRGENRANTVVAAKAAQQTVRTAPELVKSFVELDRTMVTGSTNNQVETIKTKPNGITVELEKVTRSMSRAEFESKVQAAISAVGVERTNEALAHISKVAELFRQEKGHVSPEFRLYLAELFDLMVTTAAFEKGGSSLNPETSYKAYQQLGAQTTKAGLIGIMARTREIIAETKGAKSFEDARLEAIKEFLVAKKLVDSLQDPRAEELARRIAEECTPGKA